MSDEALDAHLDWLDKCAEEQEDEMKLSERIRKSMDDADENKDMKNMLKIMGVDGYTDDSLLTKETQ